MCDLSTGFYFSGVFIADYDTICASIIARLPFSAPFLLLQQLFVRRMFLYLIGFFLFTSAGSRAAGFPYFFHA